MGYVNKRRSTASSQGISWSESKEGEWDCLVYCVCEGKGSNFQNTFPVFSSVPFFPSSLFPQWCWTWGPSDTAVLFAPDYFLSASSMAVNLYSLRVCFSESPKHVQNLVLGKFWICSNIFVLSVLLPVRENNHELSSMHGYLNSPPLKITPDFYFNDTKSWKGK